MMKVIKYWEVSDDYSEDGRGGRVQVIGNFTTQAQAHKYAKGRGNYGHDAHVSYKELTICDTVADVDAYDKQMLKAKALAKLTKDERETLGL